MASRATADEVPSLIKDGVIPVLIDPAGEAIGTLRPTVVVDARIAKVNLGTRIDDAPLVIGLGPGFTAGLDCHAVIEKNRGHALGRVIWQGTAEPDTGVPGAINGKAWESVLYVPNDGELVQDANVSD